MRTKLAVLLVVIAMIVVTVCSFLGCGDSETTTDRTRIGTVHGHITVPGKDANPKNSQHPKQESSQR